MRILVVTSGTCRKSIPSDRRLTWDDFRRGPEHVASRTAELRHLLTPAEDLYAGQQHLRLMRGVRAIRENPAHSIDLWIASSGWGMIPGNRQIVPYKCTFSTMTPRRKREWAEHLGFRAALRDALTQPYDLGLILLGQDYLLGSLDGMESLGGPTLLLSGAWAYRPPTADCLRIVALPPDACERFRCGWIGIKGEIGARLLLRLDRDPTFADEILDPGKDVLALV